MAPTCAPPLAGVAILPAAAVQASAPAHRASRGRTTPNAVAAVGGRSCWRCRTTRAIRWQRCGPRLLRLCLLGASMFPPTCAPPLAGVAILPAAAVQASAPARRAKGGRTTPNAVAAAASRGSWQSRLPVAARAKSSHKSAILLLCNKLFQNGALLLVLIMRVFVQAFDNRRGTSWFRSRDATGRLLKQVQVSSNSCQH